MFSETAISRVGALQNFFGEAFIGSDIGRRVQLRHQPAGHVVNGRGELGLSRRIPDLFDTWNTSTLGVIQFSSGSARGDSPGRPAPAAR